MPERLTGWRAEADGLIAAARAVLAELSVSANDLKVYFQLRRALRALDRLMREMEKEHGECPGL